MRKDYELEISTAIIRESGEDSEDCMQWPLAIALGRELGMPEDTEGYVIVGYGDVAISRDRGIPPIKEFRLSRCMVDICRAWSEGECDEPYTVVIEDFDIDKARNFLAGGEYE